MTDGGSGNWSRGRRQVGGPLLVALLLSLVGALVYGFVSVQVIAIPLVATLSIAPGYLYPDVPLWALSLAAAAPQIVRLTVESFDDLGLLVTVPVSYLVAMGLLAIGRWLNAARYGGGIPMA